MFAIAQEMTPGQRIMQTLVGGLLHVALNAAGSLLLLGEKLFRR